MPPKKTLPAPLQEHEGIRIKVKSIDLKNFPGLANLPHPPNVSNEALDVTQLRFYRIRRELVSAYQNDPDAFQLPSPVTDEQLEKATKALGELHPLTLEYSRLKDTLDNFKAIRNATRNVNITGWFSVTATFGGTKDTRVLETTIKEGTHSFNWEGREIITRIPTLFGCMHCDQNPSLTSLANALEFIKFHVRHHEKPQFFEDIPPTAMEALFVVGADQRVSEIRNAAKSTAKTTMTVPTMLLIKYQQNILGARPGSAGDVPMLEITYEVSRGGYCCCKKKKKSGFRLFCWRP